jgi:molecular chaperone DnaK (HSP70)
MFSRQLLNRYITSSSRSKNALPRACAPITSTSTFGVVSTEHNNNNNKDSQIRHFHATNKQEILPLIAVTVLLVGRYSYKALKRMDEDWLEYQWQLEQYERQRVQDQAENLPTTIGVDLGTIYLKLSHAQPKAELVPTADGDRYRFNGIWMQMQNDDEETMVVGRPAMDKFFYPPDPSMSTSTPPVCPVVLPYATLQQATTSHDEAAEIVQKVFVPAVSEAMERISDKTHQEVRTVLTLPPAFYNQHHNNSTILQNNFHDDANHTICLPEPVAAIWGAQHLKLLPMKQNKDDKHPVILVVDVGGLATTMSIVQNDIVLGSSTLDKIGGETFVEQLVGRIIKEAIEVSPSLVDDAMSLTLIHQQARQSVMELVGKTSTKVHIPFLYMGRRQDDPHLNMQVSRTVMEQTCQDYWKETVVPTLMQQTGEDEVLSSAMPQPQVLSGIITSALTKLLEKSAQTPMTLDHVLLVGGGCRHKLVEQSCRDGIETLMGPSSKLVVPDASVRQELTALGAVSLLPNYTYTYEDGLKRVVQA